MSMDAIVVMIFSIIFIWGGLGYFVFLAFRSRSNKQTIKNP